MHPLRKRVQLMPIEFWNRRKQRVESEAVYGGAGVNLLYGNRVGFALTDLFLVRQNLSRLYGRWQNTSTSSHKIPEFVKKFGVAMEDFEPGPFHSFNEFFVRRFLPGKRPFPAEPPLMGAFAEARYLGFAQLDATTTLPIKGLRLAAEDVLGSTPGKERFHGGPCLLARLCPVDYHRFHYPDAGRTIHWHGEMGRLHSVNPVALARKPDLFLENERQISLLQTENFGLLAYVEVGALMVGRIIHTHPIERPFRRGEEKGCFLFGASTVIVYGEKGAWIPMEDILE
ncbi:MAG: phosphatidylserine decarboxylase, partial [Bdellovibrionota bacterium]